MASFTTLSPREQPFLKVTSSLSRRSNWEWIVRLRSSSKSIWTKHYHDNSLQQIVVCRQRSRHFIGYVGLHDNDQTATKIIYGISACRKDQPKRWVAVDRR